MAFTAFGKAQTLETGEPQSVQGIENASLLLTTLLLRR